MRRIERLDLLLGHVATRAPVGAAVLLALGYFLLGRLGGHFAVSPGYSSPLWPAAGLAVALVARNRVTAPGIFVGSLFLNLIPAIDHCDSLFQATLIASTIALGSTLQALFARRFLVKAEGVSRFETPGPTAKELFGAGPVSCLIGSTIGVVTLALGGLVAPAMYLRNWISWWIGDSLGVLIFTPLFLAVFHSGDFLWKARRRSLVLPILFTIAVVLAVFWESRWIDSQRQRQVISERADGISAEIERSLIRYSHTLAALSGFLEFGGPIRADSFESFVASQVTWAAGVQAMEWVPRVADKELEKFEAKARKAWPGFRVTERDEHGELVPVARSPERVYFPILFASPRAENNSAVGFDLASEKTRRATIDRSLDSGEMVASQAIELVQSTSFARGVLLSSPIGQKGLAVAVINLEEALSDAMSSVAPEGATLIAEDISEGSKRLYPKVLPAVVNPVVATRELRFGQRTWRLTVGLPANLLASGRIESIWQILVLGLTATAVFVGFLLLMSAQAVRQKAASLRLLSLSQDLTDRTFELERSSEVLRRTNQSLEHFGFVASHDLREPLRMISNYLGLLESRYGDLLDAKGLRYLSHARDGAVRLAEMIKQLRRYSQLGRQKLNVVRFELPELLDEVIERLGVLFAESEAEVVCRAATEIDADRVLFGVVLQNLLENAIKYRREEPLKVAITGVRRKSEYVIRVSDNGRGIPADQTQRVFQIFQRLVGEEDVAGSGVGLATVAQILDRHYGVIEVESTVGVGSTFEIRLPVQEREVKQSSGRKKKSGVSGESKTRLLLRDVGGSEEPDVIEPADSKATGPPSTATITDTE